MFGSGIGDNFPVVDPLVEGDVAEERSVEVVILLEVDLPPVIRDLYYIFRLFVAAHAMKALLIILRQL